MITNIIRIIFNLFNFARPRFAELQYTDVVIRNKAYFLVSWRIERGYKLAIKSLRYRSFKRSGSAYIAVPDNVEILELVISNLWRASSQSITLVRDAIPDQVDFFPETNFKDWTTVRMYAPAIHTVFKNPQPRQIRLSYPSFATQVNNLNNP